MSHKERIQMDLAIDYNDREIAEREDAIDALHGDMVEINGIMKDLAFLVEEQAPVICTLEQTIMRASDHVEKGVRALEDAKVEQDKHSCLIM
mmetsp:Transcript_33960/g.58032  ORF Transcript_33960/g.58032 Transcript_33960/m.58032 type:complete len:92 (+) Transcript_33960:42-317(+)